MHSPLPDSSALEAGILPDDQPSRLSRVQDNVRNLLRASILGSPIRSAPPTTPTHPAGIPPTPPETPTHSPPLRAHPEVLPSPTASPTSTTSSASLTHHEADLEANTATGLFPPPSYPSPLLARMSAFFTGRALAALNHPDLDLQGSGGGDPGAAVLAQRRAEKRQRRAWKRKRSGAGSREGGGSGQCVLCVVAALMLASVVATYLIVATTSDHITTTFHVLFILGIILATIVFAHTLIRLLLFSGSLRRGSPILILPATRRAKRGRRHHARRGDSLAVQQVRVMPGLSGDAVDFVPATPIRVRMGTEEEVRPDSRDAEPTTHATTAAEPTEPWDKPTSPIANPPPAYGRWRGSVRANPDLLHWQPIPSPIDDNAQELPSPTYEEAMLAQRTGPPSYVTRDSPARTASREDVRGSVLRRVEEREQGVAPEMIEVVGHASAEDVGMAK